MEKRTQASVSELIGGIFGWIWILSFVSIPVLIIWTIWGEGRWYYVIIVFIVSTFCKALCREYKKQSEDLIYESTGIDYANEWLDLSEEEKRQNVINALKRTINKLHADANAKEWVSKWDEEGKVDTFVNEISKGYRETGLRRPYQVVCNKFTENYFHALVKSMRTSNSSQ
jgi:hypothetical protein